MLVFATDQRPDHGQLIGPLSQQGHVLTEVEPRHVGRDWLVFAANLSRCIGLEVHHILVRWAAGQEHHDHRFVPLGLPWSRLGIGRQNLGQAEAAVGQGPNFQKVAPRKTIAGVAIRGAMKGQHGLRLPRRAGGGRRGSFAKLAVDDQIIVQI